MVMQNLVRTAKAFAILGAVTLGLGVAASGSTALAGEASVLDQPNLSQSGEPAETVPVEKQESPLVDEEQDSQLADTQDAGDDIVSEPSPLTTQQASSTGETRRRGKFIMDGSRAGSGFGGSREAYAWEGEPYLNAGQLVYVSELSAQGLAVAQEHAWYVTVPEPGTWGKIQLDDERAGADNGKCVTLKMDTAPVNYANGATWQPCSVGANFRQDFNIDTYNRNYPYIFALGTGALGQDNIMLDMGIHYSSHGGSTIGVGTGASFAQKNGSGSNKPITYLYDVWNWPTVTPGPGTTPPPTTQGDARLSMTLKRRHAPNLETDLGPSWCDGAECRQVYKGKSAGDTIHFEFQLKNTSEASLGYYAILAQPKVKANGVDAGGVPDLTCRQPDSQGFDNQKLNRNQEIVCKGSYVLTEQDTLRHGLSFSVYGEAVSMPGASVDTTVRTAELGLQVELEPDNTADLTVKKSSTQTQVRPGQDISWDVEVKNTGGNTAPEFGFVDQLPEEVDFVSVDDHGADGTAAYDDEFHLVTYDSVKGLAVNGSATITVHGRVKQGSQAADCVAGGKITNEVEVYHDVTELDPSDNTAKAETTVLCDDVSLTKVVAERGSPSDDFTVSLLDRDNTALTSASTGGTDQASTTAVRLIPGETYYLVEEPGGASPADLSDYEAAAKCDANIAGFELSPVEDAAGHRWTVTVPDVTDFPDSPVSASCTITNTYVEPLPTTGSVSWSKVDGDGKPLAESTWMIERANGLPFTDVEDCVADSADQCAGPDKNPAAGEFLVEDLEQGDYTLKEVKAPAGFELCDVCKAGVDFTVQAGDGGTVSPKSGTNEAFINERQGLPSLPLTGISAQAWVWVSGGLLIGLLLAAVVWLQGPKRKAG